METVNLTEAAAARVKELIASENPREGLMLRVTISGGGCSGFQYGFSLDNQIHEDDKTFEIHDVKVVSDQASLDLLEGSEIDYVQELIGASFVIRNPNASSSCGCGNSFSIE